MKFSHNQLNWFFIDSENSGPAVMQDDDWMQTQGDIKIPYLAKSAISCYGDRRHWLDLQQCSLSIARHSRTPVHSTTCLPRNDRGQDARTSLIHPLHSSESSTQSCSNDAAVPVDPAQPEKGTAAVDNQAAHNQDDWQTQRRSKRAKKPIVPAPTRKQALTLMDLWGKKKDKTDQLKEATGADTDEPERGFQGRIPASSEEAEIELNGPRQVLKPKQQTTNSAVTCTSGQHKQHVCSLPREDDRDKALADPAKSCLPHSSSHRIHKASPNKARPDAGIARRGSQPGKPAESFTIITWNVMGLTTVMHELKQLLLSHSPDVVVITETKLNKKNCNSHVIKDIFEDYPLFHSCNAAVDPLRREANPGSQRRWRCHCSYQGSLVQLRFSQADPQQRKVPPITLRMCGSASPTQ